MLFGNIMRTVLSESHVVFEHSCNIVMLFLVMYLTEKNQTSQGDRRFFSEKRKHTLCEHLWANSLQINTVIESS